MIKHLLFFVACILTFIECVQLDGFVTLLVFREVSWNLKVPRKLSISQICSMRSVLYDQATLRAVPFKK